MSSRFIQIIGGVKECYFLLFSSTPFTDECGKKNSGPSNVFILIL
jgi:hypothetical protein